MNNHEQTRNVLYQMLTGEYTGPVHDVPGDASEIVLHLGAADITVPVYFFSFTGSIPAHCKAGYHPSFGLFMSPWEAM